MPTTGRINRILFSIILITPFFIQAQSTATPADIQQVIGSWEGTLTYLDYTSGKPYTMPANMIVKKGEHSRIFLCINSFPKEPNANYTDTLLLSSDGKYLNDELVMSRTMENERVILVTEKKGIDGNDRKPALIRHTYTLGKDLLIVNKQVKFDGDTSWIQRHEFNYPNRKKD